MSKVKRIPQETLDREWRSFNRRAASVLIHAMGEADVGLDVIGKRQGEKESKVRKYLLKLIEGGDPKDEGRILIDMFTALGGRLELGVRPRRQSPEEVVPEEAPVEEPEEVETDAYEHE
jgi:hypothetical protein